MNIFLVRHGESLAQSKGKQINLIMADHAIPLSKRGKAQVKKSGKFLASYINKKVPVGKYKELKEGEHGG